VKRPSRAGNLPRAGIVDGKPTYHSQSILYAPRAASDLISHIFNPNS